MTPFAWAAAVMLFLSFVLGSRDQRIRWAPHSGYLWGAVMFLIVERGFYP